MSRQDLYFFFNPYTGLVKIGIAADADQRRRALEFACGVHLETLAVFPGLARYEERLHEAFMDSRQVGEWFVPTPDLMGIVAGAETFDALLARYADRIAGYRREAADADAERAAEKQREKERVAVVRAEERRLEREDAKRRAELKRKRQERERVRLEAERKRIEAEQAAWADGSVARRHHATVAARTLVVRGRAS